MHLTPKFSLYSVLEDEQTEPPKSNDDYKLYCSDSRSPGTYYYIYD